MQSNSEIRSSVMRQLKVGGRGAAFSAKLILLIAIMVAGAVLIGRDHPVLIALGVGLLGAMFAHAVELQHQALHNTGFRSKLANRAVGVPLGVPMLVSFSAYQASHLRHHRNLGTPENEEFFDYGDQYGQGLWKSARGLIARFFMIAHFADWAARGWALLRTGRVAGETRAVSRRIAGEYVAMVVFVVALAVVERATGYPAFTLGWLVPLVLVAGPLHALIEMPEHFGCDTDSRDVFVNTRTIRSGPFMSWFTNGNNFHVEHHLCPSVPIEDLSRVHALIRDRIAHYEPTYAGFFARLASNRPAVLSDRRA